jgi:chemotaxis protein MotB
MSDLIKAKVVTVRRHANFIEVELRTDILYPSGSATLSRDAVGVIQRLAQPLTRFPNPIRVEGHTDDRPISRAAFPSNWELSSARAASVVHLLASSGVDPARMSVVGRAQYSPIQPNTTPEGRNANRRVTIVILSTDGSVPTASEADTGSATPATTAALAPTGGTLPAP